MPWVKVARLGKAKGPVYPGAPQTLRVVVEVVDLDEVPPGAGFPTRHEAKAAAKREPNARPSWSGEA